jgi:hypothetical protein
MDAYEVALKNYDKGLAKELVKKTSTPTGQVPDWEGIAGVLGYSHMAMFDNEGAMKSRFRRTLVELKILSQFGTHNHPDYKRGKK